MTKQQVFSRALLGCLCVVACGGDRLHNVGNINEAGTAGLSPLATGGATEALGGQGGLASAGGAFLGMAGATECVQGAACTNSCFDPQRSILCACGADGQITDCGAGGSNSGGSTASGGADAGAGGTIAGATAGNGGRVAGSAGATATQICPLYNGAGGTLITPPSNGFESGISGWTTNSNQSAAISWKQGTGSACVGSGYLACDGALRAAGWDGPKIELLDFLVLGHHYAISVAARFAPEDAPATGAALSLIVAKTCSDSSVSNVLDRLQQQTAQTDWVRLSGALDANLTGCSQLSSLAVYLETDDGSKQCELDLDDFQLWDVTPEM